jgi:hypothetical protein
VVDVVVVTSVVDVSSFFSLQEIKKPIEAINASTFFIFFFS